MIRMVELFSGIGAQASAMSRLGVEFTSVCCEIDRDAIEAYDAMHGPTENLGDITLVERLPSCDVVCYTFPCQDLSIAYHGDGMAEGSGTRSSLVWEVGRLIEEMVERGEPPKYLLMENVKALTFKKNKPDFELWISTLRSLGYTSVYRVLNAKDFGVPQNRERVFMVSVYGDVPFEFPEPPRIPCRLRDVMEQNPDPSLFLSKEQVEGFERHRAGQRSKGRGFGWEPADPEGLSPTLTGMPQRSSSCAVVEEGMDAWKEYRQRKDLSIELAGMLKRSVFESLNRVVSPDGLSPTITTCGGGGRAPRVDVSTPDEVRIRYLSPRECWRLQGFTDDEIDRAFEAVENLGTTRKGRGAERRYAKYRLAGNSIAVPCLTALFRAMFEERRSGAPPIRVRSLREWLA